GVPDRLAQSHKRALALLEVANDYMHIYPVCLERGELAHALPLSRLLLALLLSVLAFSNLFLPQLDSQKLRHLTIDCIHRLVAGHEMLWLLPLACVLAEQDVANVPLVASPYGASDVDPSGGETGEVTFRQCLRLVAFRTGTIATGED